MKNRLRSVLALASLALAVSLTSTGCMTAGQTNAAAAIGAGEGIGTKLLKTNSVGGVVDPTYLAQYEAEIPNVAGLMQGKLTPADLHKITTSENSAGLSSDKLAVVGLLNGVSSEWISVNQNTTDGAVVNNAAHNFATGLGNAVGLVTGVNYVPPTSMLTWRQMNFALIPKQGAEETVAFRFSR